MHSPFKKQIYLICRTLWFIFPCCSLYTIICIVPSVWQRKNTNSVMSPIFIEILKGSVKYAKNLSSSHMGYYAMKTEKWIDWGNEFAMMYLLDLGLDSQGKLSVSWTVSNAEIVWPWREKLPPIHSLTTRWERERKRENSDQRLYQYTLY